MLRSFILVFFLKFLALIICHADSPYAVKSISGGAHPAAYQYDTAGNRLSGSYQGNGYTIAHGLIGKPVSINIPGRSYLEIFKYGPGGSRYLRQNADGEKTFYVGGSEYQLNAGGSIKAIIAYIDNGAYSPVAKVDTTATTPTYEYYLQDHQGTPLVTVDNNGTVQSQKHYDTQGVPVAATGVHLAQSEIIDGARDFTGHERVKSIGMLHANGRMLDELTGFISPDPVWFSGNLVSLNRYAYVLNSGPNQVDVSGYAPTKKESDEQLIARLLDFEGPTRVRDLMSFLVGASTTIGPEGLPPPYDDWAHEESMRRFIQNQKRKFKPETADQRANRLNRQRRYRQAETADQRENRLKRMREHSSQLREKRKLANYGADIGSFSSGSGAGSLDSLGAAIASVDDVGSLPSFGVFPGPGLADGAPVPGTISVPVTPTAAGRRPRAHSFDSTGSADSTHALWKNWHGHIP